MTYRDWDDVKRLTRGKWKYLFLKKAKKRTLEEQEHVNSVFKANEKFFKLEWIKQRFLSLFYAETALDGEFIMQKIADWIKLCNFKTLQKWYDNFMSNWSTIKNYFKYRVSSSLSEGQNNVIKALKRRAYGYRNMAYFKLKILQVCGYLNSQYINSPEALINANLL